MNADDLRAIPEACDAAGNRVGWVPVPVATRDAIADLIDAAREVRDDMAAGALDYHVQAANRLSGVRLHEALTALDGTP